MKIAKYRLKTISLLFLWINPIINVEISIIKGIMDGYCCIPFTQLPEKISKTDLCTPQPKHSIPKIDLKRQGSIS